MPAPTPDYVWSENARALVSPGVLAEDPCGPPCPVGPVKLHGDEVEEVRFGGWTSMVIHLLGAFQGGRSAHELVYLTEPNHTAKFWFPLERLLPHYDARKTWLAERCG